MRAFDFTPYYRSTVGFDQLFDLLDKSIRSDWPPYNIEKKRRRSLSYHHGHRRFHARTKSNWSSTEATLLVTGQKGEQPEVLHQGIPLSFKQSFNLADHVKVVGATIEHGLLIIDLAREVPEAMKPRRDPNPLRRRTASAQAGQRSRSRSTTGAKSAA